MVKDAGSLNLIVIPGPISELSSTNRIQMSSPLPSTESVCICSGVDSMSKSISEFLVPVSLHNQPERELNHKTVL